ncbi:MAG: hypothetical protein AAB508_04415 [Patescibacteria group bacterium]
MKDRNIYFIIVTFKPDKDALRRLLEVLEKKQTVIVDNTDNNLGYGGGANVGMKTASDTEARWMVLVNQDVALTKEGTMKFIKILKDSEPGVIGPEAGTLDHRHWTTVLNSKSGLVRDDRVLYISGSMMAIHIDVWKATGGFFVPYFMYYEDADLSMRAKNLGFPLKHVIIEGFSHRSKRRVKEDTWIPDPSFAKGYGRARRVGDDSQTKEYYLARNHLMFVMNFAPLQVKMLEFFRIPIRMYRYARDKNRYAMRGIADFLLGKTGEMGVAE